MPAAQWHFYWVFTRLPKHHNALTVPICSECTHTHKPLHVHTQLGKYLHVPVLTDWHTLWGSVHCARNSECAGFHNQQALLEASAGFSTLWSLRFKQKHELASISPCIKEEHSREPCVAASCWGEPVCTWWIDFRLRSPTAAAIVCSWLWHQQKQASGTCWSEWVGFRPTAHIQLFFSFKHGGIRTKEKRTVGQTDQQWTLSHPQPVHLNQTPFILLISPK